jgi:hypothetical protein
MSKAANIAAALSVALSFDDEGKAAISIFEQLRPGLLSFHHKDRMLHIAVMDDGSCLVCVLGTFLGSTSTLEREGTEVLVSAMKEGWPEDPPFEAKKGSNLEQVFDLYVALHNKKDNAEYEATLT